MVEARGEVNDLVFTNLSTFETELVHLDQEGLSLELKLSVPELRVTFSRF